MPAGLGQLLSAPRRVVALLAAVVIGALTHVSWDSFTHDGRFGPRHVHWLAVQHGPLAGYRWARYASGVFGVAVIAAWLWRWWRRTPDGEAVPARLPSPPVRIRVAVLGCVLGALVAGAVGGAVAGIGGGAGPRHTVFLIATASGGAMAAMTLVLALAIRGSTGWLGREPAA